jgi:hypothetical protein
MLSILFSKYSYTLEGTVDDLGTGQGLMIQFLT